MLHVEGYRDRVVEANPRPSLKKRTQLEVSWIVEREDEAGLRLVELELPL